MNRIAGSDTSVKHHELVGSCHFVFYAVATFLNKLLIDLHENGGLCYCAQFGWNLSCIFDNLRVLTVCE